NKIDCRKRSFSFHFFLKTRCFCQ
ncbi:hypothetical protein BXA51_15735, partial [Enterococcus faecium]